MLAPPAVQSPSAPPPGSAGGVGEGAPRCAACDEPFRGPYCHACGERRPRAEDESLGHFLREQFREVTSADGRMWRTVRALFVPGKLTEEYFAGRRGLYLRPVRIFLVANVAFFFALSVFGATSAFVASADSQRGAEIYGGWAASRLAAGAEAAGIEQDVYDAAFDQKSATLATTLIGLLIPMLALCLAVVLFWRGVSGLRHLVFATHYVAFAMAGTLAIALVWVPVVVLGNWAGVIPRDHWVSYSLDPAAVGVMLAYIFLAVRRVYAVRWWQAGLATAVVALGLSPVVVGGYRFALFLVTLWTVDVPAPPG